MATLLKSEEGSALTSIRVEGVIDAPLRNVFSLMYEFDLWPSFLPGITSAGKLEKKSVVADLVHLQVWLPYPISSRDAALRVHGGFHQGSSVVIYCADAPADDALLPDVPSGAVRASVRTGGFQLFPVEKGTKTLLKGVLNVDIKMAVLPFWLLNFLTKQGMGNLIPLMRTFLKPGKWDGGEHSKRIAAEDQAAYKLLAKHVDESAAAGAGSAEAEAEAAALAAASDRVEDQAGIEIAAGSQKDVKVPVDAGAKVCWEYRTRHEGYDISFEVHFAPAEVKGEEAAAMTDDAIYASAKQVVAPVRGESGKGEYVAPAQGVAVIRFDNSYSWMYSKTIIAEISSGTEIQHYDDEDGGGEAKA